MEKYTKALATVNKSIKAIGKDRTNQQQGFKFRGIDDVMNELHSLFAAKRNHHPYRPSTRLPSPSAPTSAERHCSTSASTSRTISPTATDHTLTSPSTAKPWTAGTRPTTKGHEHRPQVCPAPDVPDPHRRGQGPRRRGARSQGQAASQQRRDIPEFTEAMKQRSEDCDTTERLKDIWSTYKTFQGVKILLDAVNAKKAELTKTLV